MALHNRVDSRILKQRLMEEPFRRITLSFYRYIIIDDPQAMRDRLYAQWAALGCFGRIYVAREGINAQMSVPEQHYARFVAELHAMPEFASVPLKIAVEDDGKSFYKLMVKVRPKLVNDGLDDGAFDVTNVGRHLNARELNEAMQQPDTIMVDMRNHYEYEVGRFEGAIGPEGATFREVLPEMLEKLKGHEDSKVVLYCTGGIRCEKASAYFRHHGFRDVNQVHGGIIDYARQIRTEALDNRYVGKNFVFDERLGERISGEVVARCHQCGSPCDTHTNCANDACHVLFIQCDNCCELYQGCCSDTCVDVMIWPREQKLAWRAERIHREGELYIYTSKRKASRTGIGE